MRSPITEAPWPRRWLPVAAAALLLGVVKAESLADPNVLWGIRDGRQILSSGNLPHSDSWSWTVTGKSWVPNSWAWDVVLGGLHRLGGGAALAILNIAVVMLIVACVARRGFELGAKTAAMVGTVLVLGGSTLLPWINDRPQLISYLFIALVVPAVGPALRGPRRSFLVRLGWLLALQVVWVNLHLFAITGPVLVGVAGVGELLAQRLKSAHDVSLREQGGRLVAAVVLSLAACGLTPYGPIAATKAVAVHSDAAGLVVEWRPSGFGSSSQVTGLIAILLAVVATWHAYRARRWDICAVLVALAVGTGIACRMAPATVVVAMPELAAAWSRTLDQRRWQRVTVGLTAASALIGIGLAVVDGHSLGQLHPASTSRGLLARLPHGCRLLNDYPLGGAVILFRPDVRVSVDSRTDLYGRDAILRNRDLVAGKPGSVESLAKQRVTCVLVPSGSGIVAHLETAGGWRVAAADAERTLLIRG